jgi:hypothetical protein
MHKFENKLILPMRLLELGATFEEFTSQTLHSSYSKPRRLCLGARKNIVTNEIVQIGPFNCFEELP